MSMNDTYDYGKRNKQQRKTHRTGGAHEIEAPTSNSELFGTTGPVIWKRQEANDNRELQPSIIEKLQILGNVTVFEAVCTDFIASATDVDNVPEC